MTRFLFDSGLRALSYLPSKVMEEFLKLGTKVTGRMIHTDDKKIFQRYGKDDTEFNYSVSRLGVNKFLLNEAQKAGVKLYFGHRITDVDLSGRVLSPVSLARQYCG